jgi:hypothetical protein
MATVQTLITEVRRTIHDSVATFRWTDVELIDYCNAAIRQTVAFLPEANTVQTIHDTGAVLASRQVLPSGGIKFIKAARNYADDGTTPQGVIRYAEKDALDTYTPGWEFDATAKADGANFFEHFCHDPREPKAFYLYPAPAVINKKLAISYSAVPTAHTAVGDTFALADEYINAAVQYITYRALTKESRHTLPTEYRQELWDNYLKALGLFRRSSAQVSPESNAPPEAP